MQLIKDLEPTEPWDEIEVEFTPNHTTIKHHVELVETTPTQSQTKIKQMSTKV